MFAILQWEKVGFLNCNMFSFFSLFLHTPVLGAWGNSGSIIRFCKGCGGLEVSAPTPSILSTTEFRIFYISIVNDLVQVGLAGEEPFMSQQNPKSFGTVSYIGVASGWGSDADWVFC